MARWYSRPVWPVADVGAALDFYVGKLGFTEAWRYEEGGDLLIAQVNRLGCEIILTCQRQDKNGSGMVWLSLNRADYDPLRGELEARGVTVEERWWGYDCLVVTDADGNELWFPYPGEESGGT